MDWIHVAWIALAVCFLYDIIKVFVERYWK